MKNFGAFIFIDSGRLYYNNKIGNTEYRLATTAQNAIPGGQWVTVAFVADRATSSKMYINGVEQELTTNTNPTEEQDLTFTENFVIGAAEFNVGEQDGHFYGHWWPS